MINDASIVLFRPRSFPRLSVDAREESSFRRRNEPNFRGGGRANFSSRRWMKIRASPAMAREFLEFLKNVCPRRDDQTTCVTVEKVFEKGKYTRSKSSKSYSFLSTIIFRFVESIISQFRMVSTRSASLLSNTFLQAVVSPSLDRAACLFLAKNAKRNRVMDIFIGGQSRQRDEC